MRIITLGTGESCDYHSDKLKNLAPDIKKFAFHRAFMLLKERDIDIDYWTWTDPDAAESGLEWMVKNPDAKHPKIILPLWNRSVIEFTKYYRVAGNLKGNRIDKHFNLLKNPSVSKNITYLKNALNYVYNSHLVGKNRFNGRHVVFHTAHKKRDNSTSYGAENVFTRQLLPICHYLEAEEVYNLGFDNQGLGFNRGVPQWKDQKREVDASIAHFRQWRKWDKEHKMKIYRCMEDRFTNIGNILPYKSLEDLCVK